MIDTDQCLPGKYSSKIIRGGKEFHTLKYPQDLNFNSNYILTSLQAITEFFSHKRTLCHLPVRSLKYWNYYGKISKNAMIIVLDIFCVLWVLCCSVHCLDWCQRIYTFTTTRLFYTLSSYHQLRLVFQILDTILATCQPGGTRKIMVSKYIHLKS